MVDEMKPIHPVAPRPRWPFTRRQVIAQIVVAAVILASGIGIGVGGTILSLKDRIIWRIPDFREREGRDRDQFGPGWIVKAWTTEYSLTGEQAQQIEQTLTKQFETTRTLWMEFAEKDKTEREKFVEAMRTILTTEQFSKWEPEFKRRTEHFQRWRPGGPGGPGGPDRMGRPDHQGGPTKPGGPDGHRDRGFRGMRGPERPPEGSLPDNPPPEGPPPGSPPPQ
jgi:hypothetical protein